MSVVSLQKVRESKVTEAESLDEAMGSQDPNLRTTVCIFHAGQWNELNENQFSLLMIGMFRSQKRKTKLVIGVDGNHLCDDAESFFNEAIVRFLRSTSPSISRSFGSQDGAFAYIFTFYRQLLSRAQGEMTAKKRSPNERLILFSEFQSSPDKYPILIENSGGPSDYGISRGAEVDARAQIASMIRQVRSSEMRDSGLKRRACFYLLTLQRTLKVYKGSSERFMRYYAASAYRHDDTKSFVEKKFKNELSKPAGTSIVDIWSVADSKKGAA